MDTTRIAEILISLRGTKRREEVAAALGLSLSAICMYETGQRVPRDEIKIALADYYGTTVEAIFFNGGVTKRDTAPTRPA